MRMVTCARCGWVGFDGDLVPGTQSCAACLRIATEPGAALETKRDALAYYARMGGGDGLWQDVTRIDRELARRAVRLALAAD